MSPWIDHLPLHPKPHPNEGLAAYCWRLSASNGLTLPLDITATVLADQGSPGATSPISQLLGMALSKQLWERDSRWWQQARYQPPRWPYHCPRCAAEKGVHYAVLDLPFISACPIHGCELVHRCPACNRPLTWQRLRHGFLCECGADLTKTITDEADSIQLMIAQLVAGATDHALIQAPKVPITGFEYSSGDLYSVLSWVQAVQDVCRRPYPRKYRSEPLFSSSTKTKEAGALNPSAVRLLTSLPESIPRKARRLRRWICRHEPGPLVLWGQHQIIKKLAEFQSDWASSDQAIPQAIAHAVVQAIKALSNGPAELPHTCFHPRYTRRQVATLRRQLGTWWARLSSTIPPLNAHSQFPCDEYLDIEDAQIWVATEEEVIDLLNLLLYASHHRLPLEKFIPLQERWRLPPALRTRSATLESVTTYLISLWPSERAYLGDLLRFCIAGTFDQNGPGENCLGKVA